MSHTNPGLAAENSECCHGKSSVHDENHRHERKTIEISFLWHLMNKCGAVEKWAQLEQRQITFHIVIKQP
jgi:hypothetical protein